MMAKKRLLNMQGVGGNHGAGDRRTHGIRRVKKTSVFSLAAGGEIDFFSRRCVLAGRRTANKDFYDVDKYLACRLGLGPVWFQRAKAN